MSRVAPEAPAAPGPTMAGRLVVGVRSPELRALTTGVTGPYVLTSSVALGSGHPADEVDEARQRLERLMASARSCVVLALPSPAPPGEGAELDDVEAWAATRCFTILQALLPALREPGRSVVLVTAADGFASAPGPLRSAVESQAVMALVRVVAADIAPGSRCCGVAVRGDLLAQADAVCDTIGFLLSDAAAHITGQTLVVGRPGVLR